MSGVCLEIPRLLQPLKLWERIELIVGDGDQAGHYFARVEDFLNQGIIISAPEFIGGETLLREGCWVTIVITRPDAAYQCGATIRRLGQGRHESFLLSPPRRATRLQRRRSVRIQMSSPLTYAVIGSTIVGEEHADRANWTKSHTVNISGHGTLMIAEEGIGAGNRLLLRLQLFQDLGLPETVVGVCARTCREFGNFLAGVEFITADRLPRIFTHDEMRRLPSVARGFDRAAKDNLVNYIFHEQIELRKKGLL